MADIGLIDHPGVISEERLQTEICPINVGRIGCFPFDSARPPYDTWEVERGNFTDPFYQKHNEDSRTLSRAVERIHLSDVPVAFPTETVYGLGADATRGSAVRGIYRAKQRPSDNPLIVHVCSLGQLRNLLRPQSCRLVSPTGQIPHRRCPSEEVTESRNADAKDPIPSIYKPLIERFWPGPLTIILPNPPDSVLAPEVTAGLPTFGARMPRSLVALALIRAAEIPLAAPSANSSTRPSPTTAEHVKQDLDGRIELILDGGPCDVGVESTVVDGLASPPLILRPGGVSIDQLRQCEGWEDVAIGYRDGSEQGSKPRAPGMKYKHYSPKAAVVLYECEASRPTLTELVQAGEKSRTIGLIRTVEWKPTLGLIPECARNGTATDPRISGSTNGTARPSGVADGAGRPDEVGRPDDAGRPDEAGRPDDSNDTSRTISPDPEERTQQASCGTIPIETGPEGRLTIWEVHLGSKPDAIARGLFSALRALDEKGVDSILVEGIRDEGDVAAAVMNRLRKAASVRIVKEVKS